MADPTQDAAQTQPNAGAPPAAEAKFKVTVDGVEKEVTAAELQKSYELSQASYARMQEAAALKKTVEPFQKVQGIMQDLRNPTIADDARLQKIAEMGQLLGLSKDEIDGNIQIVRAQMTQAQKEDGEGEAAAPKQVGFEQLAPEVKQVVAEAQQARVEQLRMQMENSIKSAIDTDPELATIKVGSTNSVIYGAVCQEVQRRMLVAKEVYGPDLVKNALSSVKAVMGAGGKPTAEGRQGQGYPSLGPAAGSAAASTFKANEPVKRAASTADDYSENFTKRLFAEVAKLGG